MSWVTHNFFFKWSNCTEWRKEEEEEDDEEEEEDEKDEKQTEMSEK